MKISGVDVSALRSPHGSTFGCLRLLTDRGETGRMLVRCDLSATLDRIVRDALLGEDARAVTALWHRMQSLPDVAGGDRNAVEGAAALDFALWDLKARLERQPLWRSLGACRPKVRLQSRCTPDAATDGDFEAWCRMVTRDLGVRVLQLDVDDDDDRSLRRLEIAACVLGETKGAAELTVHAHERWSAVDAIRHIGRLESRFDLSWVESPVARQDVAAMKRVTDSVRAAVCASGAAAGVQGVQPLLDQTAAHVVRIHPLRDGITGSLQIADAAFGFEVPVVVAAVPGDVHVHLAAALPYCAGMDLCAVPSGGVAWSAATVAQGWCFAGERIGHGLDFGGAS